MKRSTSILAQAAVVAGCWNVAFGQAGTPNPGSASAPVANPAARRSNNIQRQASLQGDAGSAWFNDDGVRKELGLTPEQFERLNRSYTDTWTRYNESMAGLSKGSDADSATRREQLERLQNTFNNNLTTTTKDVFATPAQRERYNQLSLQYQGPGAFGQQSLREQLRLNDEQMLRIDQYGRNWGQTGNRLLQTYQTNPEAATTQFNAARAETMRNINSVLTPEQRATYSQLTGTPYDFGIGTYANTQFGPTFGTGIGGIGIGLNGINTGINTGTAVGSDGTVPMDPGTNSPQPGANPDTGGVRPGADPDTGGVRPGANPNTGVRPGINPGVSPSPRIPSGDLPRIPGGTQPGTNPGGNLPQPGTNPGGNLPQPGTNPGGNLPQPGTNPGGAVPQPGTNPGGVTPAPGVNPGGGVAPGGAPGAGAAPR